MSHHTVLRSERLPPWLLRIRGRLCAALLVAALSALATLALPLPMKISVIICFDLAALTYVGLFFGLMAVATPEQSAAIGRRGEPGGYRVLVGTVVLSIVGVSLIAALVNSQQDAVKWMRVVHMVASVLALFLLWMLAHIFFAVQYLKLYYSDEPPPASQKVDLGLDYPNRPIPDLWDFMYYSFTIAMCYQTSDVTITGAAMRRVTLLHAIFSFFFAVMIIGLLVNMLSNVL
jgi:uncharacterized membrane protein